MILLNQQKSSFNEGVIFEEKHTPHFHLIRYHLDTGIIFFINYLSCSHTIFIIMYLICKCKYRL